MVFDVADASGGHASAAEIEGEPAGHERPLHNGEADPSKLMSLYLRDAALSAAAG